MSQATTKSNGITPRQAKAISYLLTSKTITEAAEVALRNRNEFVCEWLEDCE